MVRVVKEEKERYLEEEVKGGSGEGVGARGLSLASRP